ncbi:MAG TPA: DUF1697 domain-containing protein [Longimicrobiaceae bacterium]|nr:DUF1697 domain-containing protein [Longimicrobiaceae bacterium]
MIDRRIALLRGVNVGRAKRVAMADLRALVSGLGYADVRTLLNSGNVVFTVPDALAGDAAARIETALVETLGVSSRVVVLTAAEMAIIARENPLLDVATDPSRLLVAVPVHPPDRSLLEPLTERGWGPERLALGERVAYLWCPGGVLASRLPEAVGRALGGGHSVTIRNWSTMMKLHALATTESRPADDGKR